jgi:hypothetical protein
MPWCFCDVHMVQVLPNTWHDKVTGHRLPYDMLWGILGWTNLACLLFINNLTITEGRRNLHFCIILKSTWCSGCLRSVMQSAYVMHINEIRLDLKWNSKPGCPWTIVCPVIWYYLLLECDVSILYPSGVCMFNAFMVMLPSNCRCGDSSAIS